MLELIQSINIKIAGYLAIFMVVITMISHALVILKVIPYTWINGGRSTSYEDQKKQSMVGMIVLIITIPFLLISSSIITINMNNIWCIIISAVLWILVLMLIISIIMQFLGTNFERYVMSIVAFTLLVCVLRIALQTIQ